jgi:Zn-dependent alcohol dehydrogenase
VLGHEGTGVVEFAGNNVQGIAVGDRVVASFKPACGRCWYRVRDMSQHCELRVAGVAHVRRRDGTALSGFSGLGTFSEAILAAVGIGALATGMLFGAGTVIGATAALRLLRGLDPACGHSHGILG